jgi:peptidoglycan hydrolase CwlO-like protein
MNKILKFKFLFSLLLTISLFGFLSITYGDTIEDLKNKISDREVAIKNLEAEIAKTETQIDNIRKVRNI